MKRLFFYFLSLLVLLTTSCIDGDPFFVEKVYSITLRNNSNDFINSFIIYTYPDTLLPLKEPHIIGVPPNNFSFIDSKKRWEEVYKQLPADTLSIFIMNNDTVKNNDWQQIRAGYKIIKRYDLSLEELNRNNFEVNYP